jgi:hypothetical protein
VAPEELVTLRSLKFACSPWYSRKPTVPAAYALEVTLVSGVPSSDTEIVEPDTVVLTVCQLPAVTGSGRATLPRL